MSAIRQWRYEPLPNEAPELRRVHFVFRLMKYARDDSGPGT